MLSRTKVDDVKRLVRAKLADHRDIHVLCFGASLTAQGHGNGYCDHLADALAQVMPGPKFRLNRVFFGGNHLNDAGYFTVDLVAAKQPDICLLDWHSTDNPAFDDEKYVYMLECLVAAGIWPVHLIFPRSDVVGTDRPNVLQSRYVEREIGVPSVDIRGFFGATTDLLRTYLRDIVHTNSEGAKLHARLIAAELARILTEDDRAVRPIALDRPAKAPSALKFSAKPLTIEEGSHLTIVLQAEKGHTVEIVAELLIGPFAPIITSSAHHESGRVELGEKTIWDSSCYHIRVSCAALMKRFAAPFDGPFRINIDVTAKTPPYQTCKRPYSNFKGTKILVIRRLMGRGCELLDATVHPKS